MVKRQREKQYQSAREHRDYSQIRSGSAAAGSVVQRRLPFTHCALSLTPYETPVCNRDGIVFENTVLLPFLMKYKTDPVSGRPMTSRDVITLNMDKDEEGRWQCPVLSKPFADHSKIVAILQPGHKEANVISYEAFQELNVKTKNYEDLISGVKFDKTKDVIILNDPNDDAFNQLRDINNFYHVLHARELNQNDKTGSDVRHSVTASRIMEKLKKKDSTHETVSEPSMTPANTLSTITIDGKSTPILSSDVTGVQYSTGEMAGSFTSSAVEIAHDNVQREATAEEVLQAQFQVMRKLKKKGYVCLRTNNGNITLELHCDIAPRTCTNFLGLCRAGKYDGTLFHRLIKSFMIQGGKTVNGTDESIWGGAFEDEFDDRLKHSGGGVVSMANSGPGTNRCQFFITFKSCNHLDRKHSIFGKVVDGMDVLQSLERIPTDKNERPTQEVRVIGTDILEDPSQEAWDLERERIEKLVKARISGGTSQNSFMTGAIKKSDHTEQGVGKYLKDKLNSRAALVDTDSTKVNNMESASSSKKTKFGDFSGW